MPRGGNGGERSSQGPSSRPNQAKRPQPQRPQSQRLQPQAAQTLSRVEAQPRGQALRTVIDEVEAEAVRMYGLQQLVRDQSGNITGYFLEGGAAQRLNPTGGRAPVLSMPSGRQVVPHPSNRHQFYFHPPIPAEEALDFEEHVRKVLQDTATEERMPDIVEAARGLYIDQPEGPGQNGSPRPRSTGRAGAQSGMSGTSQTLSTASSAGRDLPPSQVHERAAAAGVTRYTTESLPAPAMAAPQLAPREGAIFRGDTVTHRAASDSPPRQRRGPRN